MRIRLYQIVPELDNDHLMFRGLGFIKTASDNKVPAEIYETVYSGELEIGSLDDAFVIFNTVFPEGYKGRSMSVSDVVEIACSSDNSRFYFCDSLCGFPEIEFEKTRAMLPIMNHDFKQEEIIHCGNFHAAVCDGLGTQLIWCSRIVLTRCRYSQCQLGYRLDYWNFGEDRRREKNSRTVRRFCLPILAFLQSRILCFMSIRKADCSEENMEAAVRRTSWQSKHGARSIT